MKFADAIKENIDPYFIDNEDSVKTWLDKEEPMFDEVEEECIEKEQQQEADVGLKAKECDNCEGDGMLYSYCYYGSDSECDECNGTGKIVTANIEGALYKVKLENFNTEE